MINLLVTYCDAANENIPACNNPLCRVPSNCIPCLEDIHQGVRNRDYDCVRMLNTYVCKYIYKYSSEVAHLYRHFNNFTRMDEFNILSIGCGPCSDLFAAQHEYNEKQINYYGFDLNSRWSNIHNQIDVIFQNQPLVNTNYYYQDIFELFPNIDFNPNILVLSYLFSHIHRHGNMNDFMNNLKEIIVSQMPTDSLIIINDINHNVLARNYFGAFFNLLINEDVGAFVNQRFSFLGGWNYGNRYQNLQLISNIPNNINNAYQPWTTSTSAQMIIRKIR
jgi:hypothetical protein